LRQLKFFEAIHEATDQCLETMPEVILLGLGVPDPKGIFGTTKGLLEKYGTERVTDIPTAENGITGITLGVSLLGFRPILTHQRVDFALLSLDQIFNQAAKWCYMTAGKMNVPIVIRMIIGRGWGQGPQHSQSLESCFAHIPGLKVVLPSTPHDAKGLLISSIKDNNPVIFLEHRWLHDTFGEVPKELYEIDIGKARIVKEGKDLTLIVYSYNLIEALRVEEILKKFNISIEILDLRTLRPLDKEAILNSVTKTGRVLVIDIGWSLYGVSSEIISTIVENIFMKLKAPPKRIGLKDTPIPSTKTLANIAYPSLKEIISEIIELLDLNIDISNINIPDNQDVPNQAFRGPF